MQIPEEIQRHARIVSLIEKHLPPTVNKDDVLSLISLLRNEAAASPFLDNMVQTLVLKQDFINLSVGVNELKLSLIECIKSRCMVLIFRQL